MWIASSSKYIATVRLIAFIMSVGFERPPSSSCYLEGGRPPLVASLLRVSYTCTDPDLINTIQEEEFGLFQVAFGCS